jgi:hypothetical protein
MNLFVCTIEADLNCKSVTELIVYPKLYPRNDGYYERQFNLGCWKHALCALIGHGIHPVGLLINSSIVAAFISFMGPLSYDLTALDSSEQFVAATNETNFNVSQFVRNIDVKYMSIGLTPQEFHKLSSACNSSNPNLNPKKFYLGAKKVNGLLFDDDSIEEADAWIIHYVLGTLQHYVGLWRDENDSFTAYDSLKGVLRGVSIMEGLNFLDWFKMELKTVFYYARSTRGMVSANLSWRMNGLFVEKLKLHQHGAHLQDVTIPFFSVTIGTDAVSPVSGEMSDHMLIARLKYSNSRKGLNYIIDNRDYDVVTKVDISGLNVEISIIQGSFLIFQTKDDLLMFLKKNISKFPFLFDVTSLMPKPTNELEKKIVIMDASEEAKHGKSLGCFINRPDFIVNKSARSFNTYLGISKTSNRYISLFTASKLLSRSEKLILDPNRQFLIDSSIRTRVINEHSSTSLVRLDVSSSDDANHLIASNKFMDVLNVVDSKIGNLLQYDIGLSSRNK